ncbi:13911_t:CDS:10 [Cetraspora pellucida]|uniref:13911_t:CDS:1 n=1 Tax=Cetraspora pellucida TaxID=1433469 RepID=A0A9N9H0J2_9GLOM|nr:13911_t:CDS:10 [Cetraspora pellucida]
MSDNSTLSKADPQDILDALELNRKLQKELDRIKSGIDAALQRNIILQERLTRMRQKETEVGGHSRSVQETPSVRTFGPPFFVDSEGNTPPENEDTSVRPLIFKSTRWTLSEKDALRRGVQDHNMRREALRAMREGRSIQSVEKMSKILFLYNVEEINWSQIAKQYVPTKTKEECIIQWTNHDHPCINNDEWTTLETKKLLEIVEQNNCRNWQKIALELGIRSSVLFVDFCIGEFTIYFFISFFSLSQQTNRTAAECFKQYNKQSSDPRKWSKEEDNILIRAVDLYGEKNWQQVAHCLDNRTGQQCLHRWTKTLNPAIRRGRWKKEEDEALRNAVSIYGAGNWVKVQQYVLGRTDVQCRERWMNVLNPSIKKDSWTKEEDTKLLELVKSIGVGKWAKISAFMDGRTDNQVNI